MQAPFLLLNGVHGSPYTRKMVALLRYRRIAYRMVPSTQGVPGLPQSKPHLLPTFYLPGDDGSLQPVTDSTPLIRRFDAEFAGRHAVPSDPALAFIDALLEDFADEWLSKAMFHYRWTYAPDIAKAAPILASWFGAPTDDATLAQYAAFVSGRQIPRLRYVGSNPTTQPLHQSAVTNSRVVWFSLLTIFVVCTQGALQVWHLYSFFTRRKFLHA